MTETPSPNLSLAATPEIGAALLGGREAWLWRDDGRAIRLANPTGARRIGARRFAEVAERAVAADHPTGRQIAQLARLMPVGAERLAILRVGRGAQFEALTCVCKRLDLGGGESALLVVATAEATATPFRERAAGLLRFLGDGEAGLYDESGQLIAGADSGGAGDGNVVRLVTAEGTYSLVQRAAVNGKAVAIDAGAPRPAPIRTGPVPPARSIDAQRETAPATSGAADLQAVPSEGPRAADDLADAEPFGGSGGDHSLQPDEEVVVATGPVDLPSNQADVGPLSLVPPDEDSTARRADEFLAPPAVEPSADEDPVLPFIGSAGAETAAAKGAGGSAAAEESSSAPADGTFRFVASAVPVRFVFTIDAAEQVTLVSPELAATVGPRSANIVGERWPDVAARLGVDDDGAMARALSRRDTWSGVTIYWPVDDNSIRVAVDLAALPAFRRDRSFEGFRGFGVVRSNDQRREPNEAATVPIDSGGIAHEIPALSLSAEAAAPPAPVAPAAAQERAGSSNVVRLPGTPTRVNPPRPPLSGTEQDAFQRIAEALGARAPETTVTADIPAAAPADAKAGDRAGAARAAPDRRLLDRLPTAILVVQDDVPVYANQAFLDLTLHAGLAEFRAAGGLAALFADTAGESAGASPGRHLLRRADGSAIAADTLLRTTPWGDGGALMLLFTEAREAVPAPVAVNADAAITSRLIELEAILDTATDGVVVLEADGRIVSLNRSAEALFGVNSSDFAGRAFVSLLAEESHRAALDYLDGLATNGVASVLNDGREVIGRVPRGGLIPLFMTMGPVGATGKFCAVLRDITHWKNAEEELVAARRAAEEANAQKSEFLAKISHEIRTPLNAVIGFSEVMIEERFGPVGSDRYREYLRDIHLSGSHLMSLINDLLDLSKIEAGKLELAFEAVAVNDVIQECVALMQPQANRERIIIRTSLSAGVPNIVADSRSIRQIVLNLLSNAIKFTPAGGQVIVSTALEVNGEVVIRIRDTGIGMSEKDIETALKPFRQLAVAGHTRFDGTGLGLPLTKALVEANRASFAIDSVVNQGTLVRVTFPNSRVLAG